MGNISKIIVIKSLIKEYDRRYQANCHKHKVVKETPHTMFHKVAEDMIFELNKEVSEVLRKRLNETD